MEELDTEKSEKGRKRAPNFSEKEIRLLMKFVLDNTKIIENKKTDSVTWKMKDRIWKEVAAKFNANSGTIYRAPSNLKLKYEQMKKFLKKKVMKNKQETFKTGGGTPDYSQLEWYEEELLAILGTQIHGLNNVCDSDSNLPETGVGEHSQEENIFIEVINDISEDTYMINNSNETHTVPAHSNVQYKDSTACVTTYVNKENEHMITNSDCTEEFKNSGGKPQSSHQNTWTSWTPAKLRTKKNSLLQTKRQQSTGVILNNKIDNVLDSRDELIKLQIECLKKEDERKEREHKCLIEKLNIEKRLLLRKEQQEKLEHKMRMQAINHEISQKTDK